MIFGCGAERDLGVGDDLRSYRFGRARLRALRHEYAEVCLPFCGFENTIAERDIGQVIAVVIDVDAIDGVGMKRVRIGIRVEDDRGPVLVGGRLECVQVAKVEPLIAQRRPETESSEMV